MITYDNNDDTLITSCNFDGIDIDNLDPEDIFQVESKWKDRSSLYSTVQAYAAATCWNPILSHSIYIRCSCYNRPTRNRSEKERKFASGPLCKDCQWEIKIRSTINNQKRINTGLSVGRYKSYPVVKDGINVIISKANAQHTGEYKLSKLQQVMQRSRGVRER